MSIILSDSFIFLRFSGQDGNWWNKGRGKGLVVVVDLVEGVIGKGG